MFKQCEELALHGATELQDFQFLIKNKLNDKHAFLFLPTLICK